jgi:hypothetical protein
MAGTDDKPNTTDAAARIDPTRALQRLLPAFTAHAAAARLTTAVQSNECRLWCNGDLLPPQYIATALRLIAISDVDGRWRGEIVSAVREAWEPISYVFVLDEAEVATLLPTAPQSCALVVSPLRIVRHRCRHRHPRLRPPRIPALPPPRCPR